MAVVWRGGRSGSGDVSEDRAYQVVVLPPPSRFRATTTPRSIRAAHTSSLYIPRGSCGGGGGGGGRWWVVMYTRRVGEMVCGEREGGAGCIEGW
jgi:hypothetical protein